MVKLQWDFDHEVLFFFFLVFRFYVFVSGFGFGLVFVLFGKFGKEKKRRLQDGRYIEMAVSF